MIIEIQDEQTLRNDPSDYAEAFYAAAASGTCIGNCCCSSSHQQPPAAQ